VTIAYTVARQTLRNMTGNVLLLGFAISGAHEVSITASVVALAGFLIGHEST